MFISRERKLDIQTRGKDCMVYDMDGKKVKLSMAKVWYNDNGEYFYPIEIDIYNECNFCKIS